MAETPRTFKEDINKASEALIALVPSTAVSGTDVKALESAQENVVQVLAGKSDSLSLSQAFAQFQQAMEEVMRHIAPEARFKPSQMEAFETLRNDLKQMREDSNGVRDGMIGAGAAMAALSMNPALQNGVVLPIHFLGEVDTRLGTTIDTLQALIDEARVRDQHDRQEAVWIAQRLPPNASPEQEKRIKTNFQNWWKESREPMFRRELEAEREVAAELEAERKAKEEKGTPPTSSPKNSQSSNAGSNTDAFGNNTSNQEEAAISRTLGKEQPGKQQEQKIATTREIEEALRVLENQYVALAKELHMPEDIARSNFQQIKEGVGNSMAAIQSKSTEVQSQMHAVVAAKEMTAHVQEKYGTPQKAVSSLSQDVLGAVASIGSALGNYAKRTGIHVDDTALVAPAESPTGRPQQDAVRGFATSPPAYAGQ